MRRKRPRNFPRSMDGSALRVNAPVKNGPNRSARGLTPAGSIRKRTSRSEYPASLVVICPFHLQPSNKRK